MTCGLLRWCPPPPLQGLDARLGRIEVQQSAADAKLEERLGRLEERQGKLEQLLQNEAAAGVAAQRPEQQPQQWGAADVQPPPLEGLELQGCDSDDGEPAGEAARVNGAPLHGAAATSREAGRGTQPQPRRRVQPQQLSGAGLAELAGPAQVSHHHHHGQQQQPEQQGVFDGGNTQFFCASLPRRSRGELLRPSCATSAC